jgi:hypothetical protein
MLQRIFEFFRPPLLTDKRVHLAWAVAVITDAIQLMLGPMGWIGADQALDVAAMLVTSRLIGFHPLLLPTFVLEFMPISDMLPTWTGCVGIVVALRRRQQHMGTAEPPASGRVIDI